KIRLLPIAVAAALAGCTTNKPEPAPAPAPAPTTANRGTNPVPGQGTPPGGAQDTAGRALGGVGGPPPAAAPRPYNRVITSEAKTRRGLFITHRVCDCLYCEIRAKDLTNDQLIVVRYARS